MAFTQRQPDEAEVRATVRESHQRNAHRIVGLSTLEHDLGDAKKRSEAWKVATAFLLLTPSADSY